MTNIKEALENVKILKGWRGYDMLPKVEENHEDIWLLIKYQDHGDEFLVVGTRDGRRYEYGCYTNRDDSKCNKYERDPVYFKKPDSESCAKLSNKIFEMLRIRFGFDYDEVYSEELAQFLFDETLESFSDLAEESEVLFDYDNEKYKIRSWLRVNGIDTEENYRRLEEARFDNKVGEYRAIGIAGKLDITDHYGLVVDDVEFIFVNKKSIDPEKVLRYSHTDRWGYNSQYLSLVGFRQAKARA